MLGAANDAAEAWERDDRAHRQVFNDNHKAFENLLSRPPIPSVAPPASSAVTSVAAWVKPTDEPGNGLSGFSIARVDFAEESACCVGLWDACAHRVQYLWTSCHSLDLVFCWANVLYERCLRFTRMPSSEGGGGHFHKLHAAAKEELVRAAKFDCQSSSVSERALSLPRPPVSSTTPVGRAVGAPDIALQLWDAFRDAVAAVKARRPRRTS